MFKKCYKYVFNMCLVRIYSVCKRPSKRLSRVVAFIIELYREYKSKGRPCHCAAALRSLTRGAKGTRVYHLYRNVFLAQRVKKPYQIALFSAFLTPNQNSCAFIICKNHPESRLETLILRQKSGDKRILSHKSVMWWSGEVVFRTKYKNFIR